MCCVAERYVPSTCGCKGLPDLKYPFHDETLAVTICGRICFNRQKIDLSPVFAGQDVGIKRASDGIWLETGAARGYLTKLRYDASASIWFGDNLLAISGIGGPEAA